jgi:acetyl-CoA synthetase
MTDDELLPPGYRVIPPRLNIAAEVLDRQVAAGFRDHSAFVWDGGNICFGELQRRTDAMARGLADRGIGRGLPVLIRLPNCVEFVVSFLALAKLGAIPVLQNSLLAAEEVEYVVGHSDAAAAITLANIAAPLRALKSRLPRGLIVARGAEGDETSWESLAADGEPLQAADTASDEPAFMVYTSGTTGRPKGIVHAHRWIVALGDSNRWRVPPLSNDVALATGEWSFISALGHNVLFPLRNGTTGAILEGRAQPERVLETIGRLRVTLLYSVATVYRRILALPDAEQRYDLSTLRGCSATGEALEEATWREFRRRFGCDIWEHYGVSEMQLVMGQGPRRPVRPGSVGQPIPGTRVAVMDDGYRELPPGEVGHFLIAADNPGFFLGYHKDAERTRQITRNGWYHTGDLAWRDADGYYWIAGRSDDCFKSRGIFISPYEIENALRQHPGVAEACVVALPDREIGNRIRAVIVARDGQSRVGLAESVRSSLARRIAPYKVPHVIEFADGLPKSAVGKVLRREVAATRFDRPPA